MEKSLKILLGCVPFGCDNIGDEAILKCSVAIFRRRFPGSEIWVSTNDRENTEKLLDVKTIPLYLFKTPISFDGLAAELAKFDLFVWCGATGLSDYPETACLYLEAARRAGTRVAVWNTGMNSELNPAFFRIGGKRRLALSFATGLCLGIVDFTACAERRKADRMRRRIAEALEGALLVAVRDPESKAELEKCGVSAVMVGADSALALESDPLPERYSSLLEHRSRRRIGVCISAQRKMEGIEKFVELLDHLAAAGCEILFIPMNPKTDFELMRELQCRMSSPEASLLLENCPEPGVVQAAAACCDVIFSSRLHLLILASNVNVPPVGIDRGSKVSNFLANFGFSAAGAVEDWDADLLWEMLMRDYAGFPDRCAGIHAELVARLDAAEAALAEAAEGAFK